VAVVETGSQCTFGACAHVAAASLAGRQLCPEHFLSDCRSRLEACSLVLKKRSFGDTNVCVAWQLILECAKGATELLARADELQPADRARVAGILLQVEETSRRLRRSARRAVSVPVLLRHESPGHTWEERTQTVNISRHGARLQCHHPVQIEDVLSVTRLDTGRHLEARVARFARESGRLNEIAVEFLSPENFWDWDWATEDSHCGGSGPDLESIQWQRLLNVMRSAGDRSDDLRRSLRKPISIPLRLSFEDALAPWEEETKTLLISRYGALVQCHRALQVGQQLRVARIDWGREARARVAWCARKGEAQAQLAIEFLDCDNFWGLDWGAMEKSAAEGAAQERDLVR